MEGSESSPRALDPQVRCDRCRHWERNRLQDVTRRSWCRRTQMQDGDPLDLESLAVAQDCEDYRAVLETKADFGCIQFEALD